MTQHLNRRSLLSLVAGGGVLVATGCSTATIPAIIATVATDVADIANGLLGVLPVIGAIAGITPDMIATIGTAVADLQNLAQQIRMVTDLTAAQPLVQQIEADINVIVNVLAGIRILPPQVQLALQAVAVLLPIIEAAVHMFVAPQITARAAQARMTPEQARVNLRALAQRRG